MSVILVLIPISIALAALALWGCIAALRGGQYDDLESPKWRILFDQKLDSTTHKRSDTNDQRQET
jgi:cbb3-type cytochrome oxidase maturation protein